MSDFLLELPTPPATPRRKYWGIICGLVLVVAIGFLPGCGTAQAEHHRQMMRLADWIDRARTAPPPGIDQYNWSNNLTVPNNCVFNPLSRPAWVPTEKLRELADYLDATNGKPLRTMEGLFGFIGYLEAICPSAKGYFEQLRLDNPNIVPTPLDLKSK